MSETVPPYVEGHELLKGRTVLVTAAAGTGIGFAVARKCAEEGARVMISDIHERRLGEAASELERITGKRPPAKICNARAPPVKSAVMPTTGSEKYPIRINWRPISAG